MKYLILFLMLFLSSCSAGLKRKMPASQEKRESITSNPSGSGEVITIDFFRGKSFYYPLMAFWLEDSDGKYIQTLYVANSVATGLFRYGREENNKWVEAPKRAPQTLPYWAHKRGVKSSDGLYMPEPGNEVPDAYTGPTPVTGFTLVSKADKPLPETFRVMMEINQNWDWNEYWTNDKFPGNENYRMSCQPALVYEAGVDAGNRNSAIRMRPIGHSHYSGETGELFTDLSTITTALQIADSVIIKIGK